MWRRKQEERGVLFWFFLKKPKKHTSLQKAPFPLASKNGFHISKKLLARIAGIFDERFVFINMVIR